MLMLLPPCVLCCLLLCLFIGEDRRACAARCLGELVRKMGERVLHRMLPILRDTMASPDAATRQGVCTGLKEVRQLACWLGVWCVGVAW